MTYGNTATCACMHSGGYFDIRTKTGIGIWNVKNATSGVVQLILKLKLFKLPMKFEYRI